MVVSPTRNDGRPGQKETACGVVSLRRYCPDQVPGGRRSASELSPASQPFLPAPGLPGTPFGPAPSITSQTIVTLHGADDGRLGSKARPARAKRRVSPEARGLAGRRRSCFQVWPEGHSLAVAASGPCREPIDSRHLAAALMCWRPHAAAWLSLIWPIIAALLRFARLSGQLQVRKRRKRIPALEASGARYPA